MDAHMHADIHVHMCTCAHTCMRARACTHTHTNITDKNKFSRKVVLGAGGMPNN